MDDYSTQLVCDGRDEKTMTSDKVISHERIKSQNKTLWGDFIYKQECTNLKGNLQGLSDPLGVEKQNPLTDSLYYTATNLSDFFEKVDELDTSLEDVSNKAAEESEVQNILRNKLLNTIESKIPPNEKYPIDFTNESYVDISDDNRRFMKSISSCSVCSNFGMNSSDKLWDTTPVYNNFKDKIPNLDSVFFPHCKKYGSLTGNLIPPILNDNIKYIRVSSKDLTKTEHNVDFLKKDPEPILHEKIVSNNKSRTQNKKNTCKLTEPFNCDLKNEKVKLYNHNKPTNTINGTEQETFRILVSGHLTKKETPVFIIQKKYVRTNTLIKDSLDFKSCKTVGNVNITLAGKFFHDNILIENDEGCPSALDLQSHKLLIDKRSTITQERFKHVFHLGLFYAILEGEFVENKETSQYIPIFSLEVMKYKLNRKVATKNLVNSSETNENDLIRIARDGSIESVKKDMVMPHTHQESKQYSFSTKPSQDNTTIDSTRKKLKNSKEKQRKSIFLKLTETTLFKLFLKNSGNNRTQSQSAKLSKKISGTRKRKEKEKHQEEEPQMNEKDMCLIRDKETITEDPNRNKHIVLEISETDNNKSSPKQIYIEGKTSNFRDKIMRKKLFKKKQSEGSKNIQIPKGKGS